MGASIRRHSRALVGASLIVSGFMPLAGMSIDVPSAAATDTPISSLVDSPEAIANDGSHVWVVNSTYNSVTELTENGVFVQSIVVGSAPIAVAADGTHVWVANSGSSSVTELDSNGSLLQTIGLDGQPTGISSDGTDSDRPKHVVSLQRNDLGTPPNSNIDGCLNLLSQGGNSVEAVAAMNDSDRITQR